MVSREVEDVAAWSFASSIGRGSLARRFVPAYSVFVVTGSPAKDVATGLPRNFTGGRSWNMKSHFQRSDGFDACSQCGADTGRANVRLVEPRIPFAVRQRGGDVGADLRWLDA